MNLLKTPEETVSASVKNLSMREAAEYIATCLYIIENDAFHEVAKNQAKLDMDYLQHNYGYQFFTDSDMRPHYLAADAKIRERT